MSSMGPSVLTDIFQGLEFFYFLVLCIATAYCLRTSTQDSFFCAIILWALFIFAQFPELWNYPTEMLYMHAGAFFLALGGLHNGISTRMKVLTTAMVGVDGLWIVFSYINFPQNWLEFPYGVFWWQSTINILFLVMNITVILGCRYTIKYHEFRERRERERFLARTGGEIPH